MLSGLLQTLERLINEHGSAAVLREHVALVRAQCADLERQRNDLQAQCEALQQHAREDAARLRVLEEELAGQRGESQPGQVCAHCAHPKLQRTGTRDDPVFGPLGLRRAVYECASCGRESDFELPLGS